MPSFSPEVIEKLLKYPDMLERCFNEANASVLGVAFSGKVKRGFGFLAYYEDDDGQPLHHQAVTSLMGWAQLKAYIDRMVQYLPDLTFVSANPRWSFNDNIVVSADFSFAATCVSMDAIHLKSPPLLEPAPTHSVALHDEQQQPQQQPTIPSAAATTTEVGASDFVLDQFLPVQRMESVVVSKNGACSMVQSALISLRGRFSFHIDWKSLLIVRFEFRYQQDHPFRDPVDELQL
jgi:hypothetical protein